jgi:hypothetical protein
LPHGCISRSGQTTNAMTRLIHQQGQSGLKCLIQTAGSGSFLAGTILIRVCLFKPDISEKWYPFYRISL